jgi:cephalosporin hydroxylase
MLKQLKRKFRSVPVEEKVEISLEGINKGHHKVTYKGIKAIRCPFKYVIYQMIIGEVAAGFNYRNRKP